MTTRRRRREPANPLPLHERALGLLAVRSRTRRELETRLLSAGFDLEEIREELVRLEEVGLVDDERFAEAFAEHAAGGRLEGRRSVAASLAAKGVARPTIERVLEDMGSDEEGRALELARSRVGRLASLPPETARRRLVSFLARRGYDLSVALGAARSALEQRNEDPTA